MALLRLLGRSVSWRMQWLNAILCSVNPGASD